MNGIGEVDIPNNSKAMYEFMARKGERYLYHKAAEYVVNKGYDVDRANRIWLGNELTSVQSEVIEAYTHAYIKGVNSCLIDIKELLDQTSDTEAVNKIKEKYRGLL
jgi:hypothetical protein